MLFNNFEKKYEEVINSILEENLTENDVHNLLFNLGMISNPPKKESENKEEKEKEEDNK